MAGTNVLTWLERDDWPRDFFEFLGRRLFDPDVEGMRAEVAAAARELLTCQNHTDSTKAQRAVRLLNEHAGRASELLSDPARLEREEQRLHERLQTGFGKQHGDDRTRWDRTVLRRWLQDEANVHPAAVTGTVSALLPGSAASTRRPSIFKPHGQPLPHANAKAAETTTISTDDSRDELAEISSAELSDYKVEETTCPMCAVPVPPDSVLCINCGYYFRFEKRAETYDDRSDDTPFKSDQWKWTWRLPGSVNDDGIRHQFELQITWNWKLAAIVAGMIGVLVVFLINLIR